MTRTRNTINIILTIAIFCSLFVVVFAVTNANSGDMNTSCGVNAYEYAKAPDGVYAFRYHGENSNTDFDIDTSECVVDRLYVYHSATDSVVEISAQTVSDYTCTQTALYYVTEDQKIYKTDYTGASHEYLYQCTQGTISMLRSYFDTLYFIEDQACIMHLDVANKVAEEIWEYEYLDWVFMLNDTQLIATTTEEKDYLYDISTDTATRISSIAATNMVTDAIKGTASNNARTATAPTGDFSTIELTQENDKSFPIDPYLAEDDNYYDPTKPRYSKPIRWFHTDPTHEGCGQGICKWYGGSWQCEGFARYAHDEYAHMKLGDNIEIEREEWLEDKCVIEYDCLEYAAQQVDNPYRLWPNGDTDTSKIEGFFKSLNTGAYIRYGKYRSNTEPDPEDGCHSVVFVARDANGVWVYECNQDYTNLEEGQTLDGHTQDYYGCGVFLQYHPYIKLTRYKYILHYVNHDYTGERQQAEDGYHTVGCKNCDAYIKHDFNDGEEHSYVNAYYHKYVCQEYVDVNKEQRCGYTEPRRHDSDVLTYVNENQHLERLNCCDERIVAVSHSRVTYSNITFTQHTAHYWCCNNTVTEPHTFGQTPSTVGRCTGCNYEPVPGAELNDSDQQEEA